MSESLLGFVLSWLLNVVFFYSVVEWHLFACFLTQKYVSTRSYPAPDWRKLKTREDWKKLSEKEKKELREYFRDVHDRVLDVMKDMPSALLLISRLGVS